MIEPCMCGAVDCPQCFPEWMREGDEWNDAADAAYEIAKQQEIDDV